MDCPITLDPATHCYTDTRDGSILTSVTTMLSTLFPFDAKEIARKVNQDPRSRYFGIPVDQILNSWLESALDGSELHKAIETWILTKNVPEGRCRAGVEYFSKGKWRGKLRSETIVWDDRLKMAGTVDIMDVSEVIDVWDIKSSRKIGKEKLLKFSMQLEIYARFISQIYGVKARPRGIIWFEDWMNNPEVKPQVLKALYAREITTEALDKWMMMKSRDDSPPKAVEKPRSKRYKIAGKQLSRSQQLL